MQKQQVQDINPNVLVEAKNEWLNDLKSILVHSILSEFVGIWDDCKKTAQKNSVDVYKLFTTTLKEIKNCNDRKLEEHCAVILKENNCQEEDFVRRLSCVFVAFSKVLLSVKITPGVSTLGLTIPKPKNFIHGVCIDASDQICQIPELFDDREIDNMTLFNNRKEIENIISKSIENVIRKSIPINEISRDALVTKPLTNQPTIETVADIKSRPSRISVLDENNSELYTESELSEYPIKKSSRRSFARLSTLGSENILSELDDLHSISNRKSSQRPKQSYRHSEKPPRESIHASIHDLLDNDNEDIKTIPVVKDTRRGGFGSKRVSPPPPPAPTQAPKQSNKSIVSQDVEAERNHNAKLRASVRPSDRINKARHDALFPE